MAKAKTKTGQAAKKAAAGPRPKAEGRKPAKETTTEEKIKEAARKLFTQKGFSATRTRDIAEEAGINLALLNYYFRSKQKLFDIVMMENFRQFLDGIKVSFLDENMTIAERVEQIVPAYIDFLTNFPDLPLFILNEIRGNPSKVVTRIRDEVGMDRSRFFKQIQEANKAGKSALEPFHFVANLVGLTVFPFVGRPLLQRVTGVSDEQFNALMQERKKLVTEWIKMMVTPPAGKKP